MSDSRTPTQRARDQQREFRRVIAAAIGEVRSNEVRNAFASISLEELADTHVERLEESADPVHPSRLDRLRAIKQNMEDSIEEMKATPASSFRRSDPDNDANTAPDGG